MALPIGIRLAVPVRCLLEHQNPHGAGLSRPHPSLQLPDGGWAWGWESGGPLWTESPKPEAMAGPWELKKQEKAGRCLRRWGLPLPHSTYCPLSPWHRVADNCTNKIDFNPHIPILLIGRPSWRRLPAVELAKQLQSAVCDACAGEGQQMQPLSVNVAPACGNLL